jgi:monofunctional biosynthetic peptidoglycan transglycosylase
LSKVGAFFNRLWNGKGDRKPWLRRIALVIFAFLLPLPLLYLLIFRFVPIPFTPQMALYTVTLQPVHHTWRDIDRISPALKQSVIGSEDQAFCTHHGFDWEDIHEAVKAHEEGRRLRGASTISQQVARTLFLLPTRSWVRKGVEAWLTVLVEFTWPKKRIMAAYLNMVDWGHGNFGAEAAAQAYFHVPASHLTHDQALRLAAILPNPDKWRATRGTRRVVRAHARFYEAERDGLDWCVR